MKTKPIVLHVPTDQPLAIVILPLKSASPRRSKRPLNTTCEVIAECTQPLARVLPIGKAAPLRKVG